MELKLFYDWLIYISKYSLIGCNGNFKIVKCEYRKTEKPTWSGHLSQHRSIEQCRFIAELALEATAQY